MDQMPVVQKKPLPQWLKLFLAACTGAGVQTGAQTVATDSPIHFAVEGAAPEQHVGWKCEPEGGIIGAPMVCRPEINLPDKVAGSVTPGDSDNSISGR